MLADPETLSRFLEALVKILFKLVQQAKAEREKRISSFVSTFSGEIFKLHERDRPGKDYELLVPCGVLLLNNNSELKEAIRRIVSLNLPNPIYPGYEKINMYEFLKYCISEGYDYNSFAGGLVAKIAYCEESKPKWKLCRLVGINYKCFEDKDPRRHP